jgi:Domain of unknown function (DUF1918)
MPEVGDRVRVESRKLGGVVREGVVTHVAGSFLHVQWSTGEESTFMPGPGSLTVLGKARARARNPSPRKDAPSKKAAAAPTKKVAKVGSKTTAKKATAAPTKKAGKVGSRTTAKKAVAKKAVAKKSVAKKSVAKKAVAKKAVAKKSVAKKSVAKRSATPTKRR